MQNISQFFLQSKHVYDLMVDTCTICPILPNTRKVSAEYSVAMGEFQVLDIRMVPANLEKCQRLEIK